MKISTEDVKHVAKLARLRFTDEEITPFTKQFNDILGYFSKLKAVDTSRIAPSTHAVNVTNAFREDSEKDSIPAEKALQNAPDAEKGYYKVPKIIKV
jgi:aspartyl-tRNA(Asn)/glutamyl-tRNA(Gln) amidotransferase subunit C